MAENKWIVDGHHYTCPNCEKTIAIVVNESDEGFEFCPFCGERMSGQMAENKMAEVAAMFGKKLGERFTVKRDHDRFDCEFSTCGFMARGAYENPYMDFDCFILEDLLIGKAVIVDDK